MDLSSRYESRLGVLKKVKVHEAHNSKTLYLNLHLCNLSCFQIWIFCRVAVVPMEFPFGCISCKHDQSSKKKLLKAWFYLVLWTLPCKTFLDFHCVDPNNFHVILNVSPPCNVRDGGRKRWRQNTALLGGDWLIAPFSTRREEKMMNVREGEGGEILLIWTTKYLWVSKQRLRHLPGGGGDLISKGRDGIHASPLRIWIKDSGLGPRPNWSPLLV